MEFINQLIYNLTEVHPLHPLLVHFPIALTGAALFFILLAVWRHSDALEQVAFANIALSTVSTLAAGVTGWLDNKNTYDGVAPNATAKITLAGLLLVITALITVARWRKPNLFHSSTRALYIAGYFVSFTIVAVLGFLGGVILYGFEEKPSANPMIVLDTGNHSSSAQALDVTPVPTEMLIPGISYANDIVPIFKSRCVNCHGGKKTEEGLDMTSYELLMSGSENGVVIVPGDALNSLLGELLLEKKMPKRGPKLNPDQTQQIMDWINQGALDN